MKYLINIFAILILTGCEIVKKNCCGENDIIISDIYSIEFDNKSRFISVDKIPGQLVQSKYLSSTQHHTYKFDDNILEINFYHNIINDKNYIDTSIARTIDLGFGILQIVINKGETKKKKLDSKIIDLVNNIRVTNFKNIDICYKNSKTVNLIPQELKKIGVVNYESATNRNIITIKLENNTIDTMIEKLYQNIEVIYNYLDDKDVVRFEAKGNNKVILRSYILTNSIGFKRDANEWCGMGPTIKGFECIYVNKYDL